MTREPTFLFDAHDMPLVGWTLIEASAGTGKTYALANLYVRLIVERNLSTGEILAVTFTKAATDELKGRIRLRLREALAAFAAGTSDDEFMRVLVGRVADHERARRLLIDALRGFDQAAIYTIHGFCMRSLRRCAFESASLFDTELTEDETGLLREIVYDFWRITFYPGSGQFLKSVRQSVGPERLLGLIRSCGRNPFLRIEGGIDGESDAALEARETRCMALLADAHEAWRAWRQEVSDILTTYQGFNRNVYSASRVERTIDELDRYFLANYLLPAPEAFQYVCFDQPGRSGLKRSWGPPEHAFFDRCAALRRELNDLDACYEDKLARVRRELIRFVEKESSFRKRARNVRSYNDLLLDLHEALEGRGGIRLAGLLRETYKVALIDEFQDTDPLQYAIFTSIYRHENATLFLIGDPKQAIFRFRGADVFAYINAARDVDRRYTLDRNWRSSEPLIAAINALFEATGRPFILDALEFLPVKAGDEKKSGALLINGVADPSPFTIWFMRRSQHGKAITRGSAKAALNRAVVSEIARLLTAGLSGRATLDDRALRPSDIAVIVRTNREAGEMQLSLRAAGIPSVVYSSESVFLSEEAQALERVLRAVSDPRDEGRIRAALATSMFGKSGDELAAMIEKEQVWEKWIERFDDYHGLWLSFGFVVMARLLIASEQVKRRLRAYPDGDRRITNLLHCVELLHKASVERKFGMEGLLKWFAEKRQSGDGAAADEYQIRLETDDLAVKIVTIHRSKGLEYAVCFCPFLWGDASVAAPPIAYHDPQNNCEAVLNVCPRPDDALRKCAEQEQLAENIRLTYVALTRAQYRCYMAWGFVNESQTSALAYLFHGRKSGCGPDVHALEAHLDRLSDEEMEKDLMDLKERSAGAVHVTAPPEGGRILFNPSSPAYQTLEARSFSGRIERDWRVSSFSALTSGRDELADLPDRDQEPGVEASLIDAAREGAGRSVFDFPRGTAAGSCLHEIFEKLDFSRFRPDETRELVAGLLGQYGFASEWTDIICALIRNTLSAPLECDDGEFALSTVSQEARLHELEFHTPLAAITAKGLAGVFRSSVPGCYGSLADAIQRLSVRSVRGMLKGYIDMVFEHRDRFYIVDWKSNHLGNSVEDYARERLAVVMERELYVLQSHIYAVALHRYLTLRLPGYDYDRWFGGVYYLFLRGLTPEHPGHGVFFERPGRESIEALSGYLTGG